MTPDTDETQRTSGRGVGRRVGEQSRRQFLTTVGAGAAGLAAGATGVGSAQADGRTLPWLHRDGNEIKDPEGNRVVLHGVNVVDPARGRPEWGHMHTEDAIDLSTNEDRGWHSRVIRLPMQPQDIGGHGPGAVEAVAFDESDLVEYCENWVDPVVEKCREEGLYIMLDYHRHYPEGAHWDSDELDEELRIFWNVVGPRYAEYSHVIYELYNEPAHPYPAYDDPTTGYDVISPEIEDCWLRWRDHAQPWVNMLRDLGEDQIIVIGSPSWDQFTYWAAEHEFEGENLAYSAHVYAHENLRPLERYFGQPAEEVPVFMSEYGFWPFQDSPYLTGSADVEGEQFRQLFEDHPTMHTQAWCFDHSWTPSLLEQEYDDGDRRFYVDHEWGEWTQSFLADHADTYLPEAPTDAGPIDPGEPTAPSSPSDLTAEAGSPTTIQASWSAVSDADRYNVYLDDEPVDDTTSTAYTFEDLAAETTYAVGVDAENDEGASSVVSTTVTTPPEDGGGPCEGFETMQVEGQRVCNVDGDEYFRDVNGDGNVGNRDVGAFFENFHLDAYDRDEFDYSGNGRVSHGDVVSLFDYVI